MAESIERRRNPRHRIVSVVNARIESLDVGCYLRNISRDGALLQVQSEFDSHVSGDVVGKPLEFQYHSPGMFNMHYFRGVVKRFSENEGARFIAVAIREVMPLHQEEDPESHQIPNMS